MQTLKNPLNEDSTPEQIMAHQRACMRTAGRSDDHALELISNDSEDDVLVSAALEELALRQSAKDDPRVAQALGR